MARSASDLFEAHTRRLSNRLAWATPSRYNLSHDPFDPNGLLPSQFLKQPTPEFNEDQRLCAAMIHRALDDWKCIFNKGHVLFEPLEDFGLEEAQELRDWIFSGAAAPLSLSACCDATGYEVEDVRIRAEFWGFPFDLDASVIPPRNRHRRANDKR